MAEDLWVQLVPGKADKLSPRYHAVQSHTKENIDEENAIIPFYTDRHSPDFSWPTFYEEESL